MNQLKSTTPEHLNGSGVINKRTTEANIKFPIRNEHIAAMIFCILIGSITSFFLKDKYSATLYSGCVGAGLFYLFSKYNNYQVEKDKTTFSTRMGNGEYDLISAIQFFNRDITNICKGGFIYNGTTIPQVVFDTYQQQIEHHLKLVFGEQGSGLLKRLYNANGNLLEFLQTTNPYERNSFTRYYLKALVF